MNLETATKEVMKILKQVMEEKLTSANVEVSAIYVYLNIGIHQMANQIAWGQLWIVSGRGIGSTHHKLHHQINVISWSFILLIPLIPGDLS